MTQDPRLKDGWPTLTEEEKEARIKKFKKTLKPKQLKAIFPKATDQELKEIWRRI